MSYESIEKRHRPLLAIFNYPLIKIMLYQVLFALFESTGVWDVHAAEVLNKLMEDLTEWTKLGYQPEAFFEKCILSLVADKSYFKQIIQARVLHLLRNNLKANFTEASTSITGNYLECHIYESDQESHDHFLIRAAMSGLAASLTGFHTLCIHHSNWKETPDHYKRTSRNIHHLLQLESSMYKGEDPLSGAYSIDYFTKAWTQKIWDALRF
jgi:methylmalonyl-CoA mutase N-terminal domain/subunit